MQQWPIPSFSLPGISKSTKSEEASKKIGPMISGTFWSACSTGLAKSQKWSVTTWSPQCPSQWSAVCVSEWTRFVGKMLPVQKRAVQMFLLLSHWQWQAWSKHMDCRSSWTSASCNIWLQASNDKEIRFVWSFSRSVRYQVLLRIGVKQKSRLHTLSSGMSLENHQFSQWWYMQAAAASWEWRGCPLFHYDSQSGWNESINFDQDTWPPRLEKRQLCGESL